MLSHKVGQLSEHEDDDRDDRDDRPNVNDGRDRDFFLPCQGTKEWNRDR
jgi:hypothetical protein